MAITWKNIDAPNAGIAALGRTGVAAIGQGTQGLSKAFNDIGDRDRERRTSNALSQIAGIDGLDNFDEQKVRILDSLGINTDRKAVTEALIGRRQDLSGLLTDKLSQEQDRFDLSQNEINAKQQADESAQNILESESSIAKNASDMDHTRYTEGKEKTALKLSRASLDIATQAMNDAISPNGKIDFDRGSEAFTRLAKEAGIPADMSIFSKMFYNTVTESGIGAQRDSDRRIAEALKTEEYKRATMQTEADIKAKQARENEIIEFDFTKAANDYMKFGMPGTTNALFPREAQSLADEELRMIEELGISKAQARGYAEQFLLQGDGYSQGTNQVFNYARDLIATGAVIKEKNKGKVFEQTAKNTKKQEARLRATERAANKTKREQTVRDAKALVKRMRRNGEKRHQN